MLVGSEGCSAAVTAAVLFTRMAGRYECEAMWDKYAPRRVLNSLTCKTEGSPWVWLGREGEGNADEVQDVWMQAGMVGMSGLLLKRWLSLLRTERIALLDSFEKSGKERNGKPH